MASRVEIVPGTARDLSYVAANMRDCDRQEIFCQLPPGTVPLEVAAYAMNSYPWVARLDGQPVACFGFVPRSHSVLEAWAWGTERMPRAIPEITRFVARHMLKDWLRLGIRRLEARSIITHTSAHRWMLATGAVVEAAMPDYGCNGEGFLQLAWTREGLKADGWSKLRRFMKDSDDVLLQAEGRHDRSEAR